MRQNSNDDTYPLLDTGLGRQRLWVRPPPDAVNSLEIRYLQNYGSKSVARGQANGPDSGFYWPPNWAVTLDIFSSSTGTVFGVLAPMNPFGLSVFFGHGVRQVESKLTSFGRWLLMRRECRITHGLILRLPGLPSPNMPHANITAGIWFRNARWPSATSWRTDMPVSVFSDPYVRAARFALMDGPVVQIPMAELRSALAHAPTHDKDRKVGPFNVDPFNQVIEVLSNQTRVPMEFGPFLNLDRDEIRLRNNRYVLRPPSPTEFTRMAEIVMDRIRSGRISFDQFVERVQDLNPALTVVRGSDGSISLGEIAYVLRINHLRAIKGFEDELLDGVPPTR